MAIIRWEPFRMEDFPELRLPKIGSDLAVDVFEKDNNVVAEMNLPGVDPDNLDIDIEDDYVRVSGSREERIENKEADYYYQEIQRGSFERTFRLPTKVDPSKTTAEFDDGVLKIVLPMIQNKQPQKIKPIRKAKAEKPVPAPVKDIKSKSTKIASTSRATPKKKAK